MKAGYSPLRHENLLCCTLLSKAQRINLDTLEAGLVHINTPFDDIDLEKEARIQAAKQDCAERRAKREALL